MQEFVRQPLGVFNRRQPSRLPSLAIAGDDVSLQLLVSRLADIADRRDGGAMEDFSAVYFALL